MKKRLEQFGICVVVIAEGAGQVSLQFYLLGRMCAPQCIGEIFALRWQMILEIKLFWCKKVPKIWKISPNFKLSVISAAPIHVQFVVLVQDLLEGVGGTDASGNPILGDVGKWFYGKVCPNYNILGSFLINCILIQC